MSNLYFLIIMVPTSLLFTSIGIYAWRRKKPMWFWAGDTVSEDEITDVRAYNRANGIMWLCFSLPLWIGTIVVVCHNIFRHKYFARRCYSWISTDDDNLYIYS